MPTTSSEPTSHPSLRPSVSNLPSVSIAPSQAGAFPSSQPSGSAAPSSDPTGSYNVRKRAKCDSFGDEDDYLPGVVVIAFKVVYSEWIEVRRTVTDVDGYYEFNGLDSPMRDNRYIFIIEDRDLYCGGTSRRLDTHELKDMFVSSGEKCELAKPEVLLNPSTSDVPHYESLFECCAAEFFYDMDKCMSPAKDGQSMFYATYIKGSLCSSKTEFEPWETSFETLEECCNEVFYFDKEECMKSSTE